MGELAQAWTAAVVRLGGDTARAAEAAAELECRYAEPHRCYHGVGHIQSVLRECAALGVEVGLEDEDRALVSLAGCAHDVVYDARPGADERASAAWATERLTSAGVPVAHVATVQRLVRATITHEAAAGDLLAGVLLDADLAILGSSADEYAAYAAAIRQEYRAVSEQLWRRGRRELLRSLLNRPQLFVTDAAQARWDAAARRNLQAELAGLA